MTEESKVQSITEYETIDTFVTRLGPGNQCSWQAALVSPNCPTSFGTHPEQYPPHRIQVQYARESPSCLRNNLRDVLHPKSAQLPVKDHRAVFHWFPPACFGTFRQRHHNRELSWYLVLTVFDERQGCQSGTGPEQPGAHLCQKMRSPSVDSQQILGVKLVV